MGEAKISFRCPGCEEVIGFPGTEAGTVQDCPACGGWVDVPELTRSPKLNDPWVAEQTRLYADSARQSEDNARLIERSVKSHVEWERQLRQSAKYQDQSEAAVEHFARLMTRWEDLVVRFEKMLTRLEKGQP